MRNIICILILVSLSFIGCGDSKEEQESKQLEAIKSDLRKMGLESLNKIKKTIDGRSMVEAGLIFMFKDKNYVVEF